MVKVYIELESEFRILTEITYASKKVNKLIQWIKPFNQVWKFEFLKSKYSLYNKKRIDAMTWTDKVQAKRLILRSIEKEKEYKNSN